MVNGQPTRQELSSLAISELIAKSLTSKSFGYCYRNELMARHRQLAPNRKLEEWLESSVKQESVEDDERVRDVRREVNSYKRAPSLCPLAQAILDSGWDGTDPKGKSNKAPEEYLDFLRQLAEGADTSWSDVDGTTFGRLFKVIVDAYNRFMFAQNG